MKTKAIGLGIGVGALSTLGTFVTLTILLFGTNGRQPFREILPFLLLAMVPGSILAGLARLLPVDAAYKKAIALGLLVPACILCAYFGIGLSQ